MATELDEETRRLIKLFRPAKDAETSWRIDVSAELAWYLDMLQQEDAKSSGLENTQQLNNGLASVIAYEGINFSQASAVVMEATRVFSRKVDFLRRQMDSTLTTILTGSGGVNKKTKNRKQRVAGACVLPEWELPDIPDSTDFMHLPLKKLTGFSEFAAETGKHIIPLERELHHLDDATTAPRRNQAAVSIQAPVSAIHSEDEDMTDGAPPAPERVSIQDIPASPVVESPYPACKHLKEVAIVKKQVLSRPNVHLLAPVQVNTTLADSSFHFSLLQFCKTHATTRAEIDSQGVLSFPTYGCLFKQPVLSQSNAARFSFSPRIGGGLIGGGGGDCGAESILPSASMMASQHPSAVFGGLSTLNGPIITPVAPVVLPKGKSRITAPISHEEPLLHNEHEPFGPDLPIKVGNPAQKIQVSLYTRSLEKVCEELKTVQGTPEFLDRLFLALTGSYGVQRFNLYGTKQPRLPFFTDIKRSMPTAYHFKWDLPPKERQVTSRAVPEGDMMGEGSATFENQDYGGDELDEATLRESIPHEPNGSESVMLVDTFSRLEGRLSIIGGPAPSVLRGNAAVAQMHERIGIWRQRVEHWMNVAENENSFDIPACIEKFRAFKAEAAATTLAVPNAEPQTLVSFRALCKGAQRHEVCRLFLTSLLLVNRYSLTLEQDDVFDFRLDLDRLADTDEGL